VDVTVRDVDTDLLPWLATGMADVAFPVLHGASGEDGTIREILDLVGLPYVGATPAACRAAFDKPTAKAIVAAAGLLTPVSVTVPREAFHDLGAAPLTERILARVGLPLVVKPRAGGSAFGVTSVATAERLAEALMACFGYHDWALIEQHVSGTEITVGVVEVADGPVALPPVEIVPDSGVYDYAARYTAGATEFFCPARLAGPTARRAEQAALTAHRALGLRDLSRTDMIVDGAGAVYLLETNVAPGLTPTSTFPIGLDTAGLDFPTVCRDLAARAAHRAAR
jgi:D-alanine-D-alanine ligase